MAICSLVLGVLVNEICAGGDYRETVDDSYQAFLEDPNRPVRECGKPLVLPVKIGQSILTGCLLIMIIARFKLRFHQTQVIQRLKDRQVGLSRQPSPCDLHFLW